MKEKIITEKFPNRVLTYEDRKKFKELLDKGMTIPSISVKMKIAYYSLTNELHKNGGVGNYEPEEAQNRVTIIRKPEKKKPVFLDDKLDEIIKMLKILIERP